MTCCQPDINPLIISDDLFAENYEQKRACHNPKQPAGVQHNLLEDLELWKYIEGEKISLLTLLDAKLNLGPRPMFSWSCVSSLEVKALNEPKWQLQPHDNLTNLYLEVPNICLMGQWKHKT